MAWKGSSGGAGLEMGKDEAQKNTNVYDPSAKHKVVAQQEGSSKGIQQKTETDAESESRTIMVEGKPTAPSPSTTERESSRDLNGNRCITVGLRSSLRGGMPTEDMDTGRKDPKDKRTRVDSCNSSSEILHRTKKKHESSDMDRQRDSDGLHKQERRNKVGCNASLCAPVLGTSTEEGAPDNSMLYKHKAKHNSGLLITNISRQKGLVSKPKGLQQDHREAGSSGSGHDGHAEQQESRALRLMAERGSSSGYRRLLTGLEQVHKGLHIPRSSDDRKGHQEAEPVYDRDHTDCTNVEEPSMVPPGSRSPNRLPKVAPNDDRPDPGSKKPEPPSTRKGGLKLGGLESLRVRMEKDGFSKEVAEMVGERWKHSTRVTYEHSWNTWYNWCTGKLSNPVSAPITDIAQFLLDQYSQRASYNKLGVLRSALSAFGTSNQGPVGQDKIIVGLMKGFYNNRPPRPRYSATWNIDTVLDYWISREDNKSLSLKDLSYKAVTLVAVNQLKRASEINNMMLSNYGIKEDRLEFLLYTTPKHQRRGSLLPMVIKKIINAKLDPVSCLLEYIDRTKGFRELEDGLRRDRLFLSLSSLHREIKSCTVSRWIQQAMNLAGVCTTFKPHSIRGASASAAHFKRGASLKAIMKRGQWSSESVLKRFYIRPLTD